MTRGASIISTSIESLELIKVWEDKPELIRHFIRELPQYEQLCVEVAYILEKHIRESKIEFSSITYRAKSLNSFAEKIIRKKYKDPFSEITDIAGVRLVHLYKSDFPILKEIIHSEFEVIEEVDTVEIQGTDKFGYSAFHFLVRLGRRSSGARYDDLKGLVCEIQTRTVLQDAWAIIGHHLSYKEKAAVPEILSRKLNSVVGLFEMADDQFDRIRTERESYLTQVNSKLNKKTEFLEQKINLDTVRAFLKWHFPYFKNESTDAHISVVIKDLDVKKYSKLLDLEIVLLRTEKARKAINIESKSTYAAGELAGAIALDDLTYRQEGWEPEYLHLFNKYEYLVEKNIKKL